MSGERKGLIASIVLNVFLLLSVLGLSYGWPLFIHVKQVLPKRERHVSFFEDFPVRPGDVVFVGDAITDEGRWSELFPGLPVKNRGIPGDTTEDLSLRIGQVAAGKPRKIFLMIGGGDAEAEKTVENTRASYETILTLLERDTPESEVYVQSILPRSVDAWPGIEERNRAIREVTERHGATYLDLVPVFAAENGAIRELLSNDNVHLRGPGYAAWRDAIAPHVTADPTASR